MGKHPTDRGKLGAKRSLLTAGGGVPIGLAVEGAHRHAVKMVRETLARIPVKRPTPATPQGMCLDKGDDDDEVRDGLAAFGEIGLTGRLRQASQAERRLEECAKLGIALVVAPEGTVGRASVRVASAESLRLAIKAGLDSASASEAAA